MKFIVSALLALPLGALAGTAQWCNIVNVGTKVNCRAGPHLDSKIVRTFNAGENLYFLCYKRGDCYEDNCTWDKHDNDCYVNGYFTDNHCTIARLGEC